MAKSTVTVPSLCRVMSLTLPTSTPAMRTKLPPLRPDTFVNTALYEERESNRNCPNTVTSTNMKTRHMAVNSSHPMMARPAIASHGGPSVGWCRRGNGVGHRRGCARGGGG